jgi:hypothetical protein
MDYLLGSAYPALDHHPAVISMSSDKEKVSARERARRHHPTFKLESFEKQLSVFKDKERKAGFFNV